MEIQQIKRDPKQSSLKQLRQELFATTCQQRHTLVVLVFITCMQLAILLFLVGHWSVQRNAALLPYENTVCIRENTSPKSRTVQEYYCDPTSDVFRGIVKKAVSERYNNEASPVTHNPLTYNRRCSEVNKTRASAVLNAVSSYAVPNIGQPTKIFWIKNPIVESFCNVTDVEREGTINIERSGFYLLSSKLTFKLENGTYTPSYTLPGEDFRHYMKLISNQDETERILVENSMSKCYMHTRESEKTSHIEAVFKLVKGDRIYVAASHAHKIICAPLKNSFAIYSL